MKKRKYIAPETFVIKVQSEYFLTTSPTLGTTNYKVSQYDGDQLHNDISTNNGSIAGPASEYVGTANDNTSPIDEGSIFN